MIDPNIRTYVVRLHDEVPPASGDLSGVIRRGRHRKAATRGASVMAAVAGAAVVIGSLPNPGPGVDFAATTSTGLQQSAPTSDLCGPTFPIEIHVPSEYGEVANGPAPAGVEAVPGQIVRHWQGADTTLEVRWPADASIWVPDRSPSATVPADAPTDPAPVTTVPALSDPGGDTTTTYTLVGADGDITTYTMPDESNSIRPVHTGESAQGDMILSIGGALPVAIVNANTALGTTTFAVAELDDLDQPCDTLQVARYGAEPADVDTDVAADPLLRTLLGVIWGPTQLVKDTIEVESAPVAIECGAGADDDYDYPPRKGGPVDLGRTFHSPEDALEGFLAQAEPGVSRSDYTKLIEPDGSVSFGYDAGLGYVTVVSVVEQDGRWTVDAWDSAGC